MADNIAVTAGSGKTIAADEVSGVLHQRVKISVGADGEAADLDHGQATMANSLPVVLASDQSTLAVSAASLPLPSGAATAANQTTLIGHVDGIEALLGTIDADTSALAGAVAGTEVQVDVLTMPTVTVADGGGSLTIDGTVAVSGTVAVTDNSGSLTVDGTVTVQDGGSTISVDDGSGSITVDGTVTIGDVTTKALTTVCSTAASSGDNSIVAAPGANTRIVVAHYSIQLEAATATTVLLKSGSTTKRRALLQQYDSFGAHFAPGYELRLGTNEALQINLSGANSVGYHFDYFTEAV